MIESPAHYKEGLSLLVAAVTSSHDDLHTVIDLLGQIELWFLQDIDRAYQASADLFHRSKKLKLTPELAIRLLMTHAKVSWGVGQYNTAIRLCNQALKQIYHSPVAYNRAEIYLQRGIAYLSLKRYLKATEDFVMAVEAAIDSFNVEVAIESFLYIGSLYAILGQNSGADEFLKLGLQLARAIESARLVAKSTIFLAGRLIEQEQYQTALKVIYQGEESVLVCGDMTWVVEAGKSIAVCYQYLGRDEEAELYFSAMLALSKQQNIPWANAVLAVHYADFLLKRNELNETIDMLDWAEPGLLLFDDLPLLQKSSLLRIETCKQLGDFKNALAQCRIYEKLKLRGIEGEVSEQEIRKAARMNRLNQLMLTIEKTKNEFERLLGVNAFGVAKNRGKIFKDQCLAIKQSHEVLLLNMSSKLTFRRFVDRKVENLLREFCIHGDLWVRVNIGEFLIFFAQGELQNSVLQSELSSLINNFPWDWHDCETPRAIMTLISASDAADRIKEEIE